MAYIVCFVSVNGLLYCRVGVIVFDYGNDCSMLALIGFNGGN